MLFRSKSDALPFPPLNYVLPPRIPDNCRILVFHGTPKMEQALEGYRSWKWNRTTRPATWLKDYWLHESR